MDKITKGNKAKRLLEDGVFRDAMDSVETAIMNKWRSLPVADLDGQHQCKVSLMLLGNVEANLRQFVEDGMIEEFQLEQDERSYLGDIPHGRGPNGKPKH